MCEVIECFEESVKVRCLNEADLGENAMMILPGCNIDLPTLTDKDVDDITEFAIKRGVDIISASFIRKASDIETIRDVLGPNGAHIKIIAKIENQEGLSNFDSILEASDGIMVARAALAQEIPAEKVFMAQHWMINKCTMAAKPVITATQVLESMITKPRPTRSEASDIANAVMDGSDSIMLSGETATGEYPVNAVSMVAKITSEAEKMIDSRSLFESIVRDAPPPSDTAESAAASAASSALKLKIDLIILLSETGRIGRLVAKYKPTQPILVCSTAQPVVKQANLTRGVSGWIIPSY